MSRLSAVFLFAAIFLSNASAQETECSEHADTNAHALLQKGMAKAGAAPTLQTESKTGTNPSGAAAPLNEEGYSAVADRFCHAEMAVFIERVIFDQGLQICEPMGLEGFTPWHSGESTSSFAALTADLLKDAAGPCPWVQVTGTCKPLPGPPTCKEFPAEAASPYCSCSRSMAAKINLATATLAVNNLDGQGPGSGASEMRITGTPGAGVTNTGQAFDVVITSVDRYVRSPHPNGLFGDFGKILLNGVISSTFTFSFVEPGTSTPVTVPEIHMAVFDLDGTPTGADTETASSKGYAGYVTDPNPLSVASRLPDGRTEFKGITGGSDPSSANALTDAELKSSIMFFYNNVASFDLTFGSNSAYTRGLMFAFESSLNLKCAP